MNWLTVVFVILRTLTNPALGAPLSGAPSEPDPALAFTVQLDNLPFVNKVRYFSFEPRHLNNN